MNEAKVVIEKSTYMGVVRPTGVRINGINVPNVTAVGTDMAVEDASEVTVTFLVTDLDIETKESAFTPWVKEEVSDRPAEETRPGSGEREVEEEIGGRWDSDESGDASAQQQPTDEEA